MKRKELTAYFDARWQAMTRHMHAFAALQQPESLHRMRVEIKKIKSMMTMLDACRVTMSKPVALDRFFRLGGKIRDTQLLLQRLKSIGVEDASALDELQLIVTNAVARFKSERAELLIEMENERRRLRAQIIGVKDSAMQRYFEHMHKKLSKYFEHPVEEMRMHSRRHDLKQLLYNAEAFAGHFTKRQRKVMDGLQDAIGKWHDDVLALKMIGMHRVVVAKKERKLLDSSMKKNWRKTKKLSKRFTKG